METRLERIERRLEALEARFAVPSLPLVVRTLHPTLYAAPSAPDSPRPEPGEDLESLIGARWLPRAGGVAIVLSLAYLVKLGLDRGLVTPTMVVTGIALVCLALVGLGLRLREEREAYGHVLVGIGVGGLYIDAVGAHFAQGVLTAEAMVGTCLVVSLATLGYGCWRALPSFLGIGLLGGLIAATMSLSRGLTTTPVGLFLLVGAPAFAISAVRRWTVPTMAAWAGCALASLGFLFSSGPLELRLIPIDAALLMGVAAWAWTVEGRSEFEGFPPLAVVATTPFLLGAYRDFGGGIHLALLGTALAAIGYGIRRSQPTTLAGAILGLALAPLALPNASPAITLASLALVEVALLRRRFASFVAGSPFCPSRRRSRS